MNFHLFVIMLLVALLFASSPIDGAKNGKSKGTNTTLTTTTADVESKTVLTDNVSSDRIINNATKINEKASYPKKVHSLKKRPTKTPTSYVTASATQNSKNKRKKVTDVTAAFKDLPADDLEFINELDKQFQLHGEKIKIKVEHDNSTESEKQNSKRTIDGELGYGAYHAHNGYQYERPKFMFYPYSQQNIPVDAPGYYPPKTDVSIEPSYSYELQSQSYVQKHGAQQPPEVLDVPKHGAQGGYEEPVIVLRIPGPTKYASHLQTLLQQYLEIRAAQYLRILQENELHKQHQQHTHQHLEQQQQQQQQEHLLQQEHILQQQQQQHAQQQQHEQQAQLYEQQALIQHGGVPAQQYAEPTLQLQPPAHEQHVAQHAPAVNEEHGYSPEVTYAHQIAPTPQAVVYSDVDEIYQGYKGKLHAPQAALQQQQHHEQQQQVEYVQQQHEEALEPQQLQHGQQYFLKAAPPSAIQQYYYTPGTQFGPHGSHHYQNVYFMAIAPQSGYTTHAAHAAALQHQPIYVQEEEQEQELQQQHHQHQQAQHELAATAHGENNPRQTHTKVIYTQNSEKGAADYTGSYALPSVRPYERHAAASAPAYQHQQQLQEQLLHEHQQQQQHEQLEQQQQFDYDAPLPLAASEQEHAHQRSAAIKPEPFNYHAHGAKALRRVNRKRGAPALKSTTAVTTDVQVDEHLQKIRKFVRENLGAQMSTAVEFKTTALVKS